MIGIIFCVIIIGYIIWLCAKYFILLGSNSIAFASFKMLHEQINKRYELIIKALEKPEIAARDIKLVSETTALALKALDFTPQKEGVDRIIRFANAVFDNAEKLSLKFEDELFDLAKSNYNENAKKLRQNVDVFPTSLMARLVNIKTMDYLK